MLQRCATNNATTSFSILFPLSTMEEACNCYSSAASSSVDCTLSLGPPSSSSSALSHAGAPIQPSSSTITCSCTPSFCWDIVNATGARAHHSKTQQPLIIAPSSRSDGNEGNLLMGGDPLLLARRCANCDTTSTPLWRNGPRGPKSLCNACGIRYKKEERRAAASATSPACVASTAATHETNMGYTSYPWSCYPSTPAAKTKSTGAAWCGGNQNDHSKDMDQVPNYLSFRLDVNVAPQFSVTADRPSLFQFQ